jgi:hypothetical protein
MLHILHVIQIIEVLLYIEALHVKALHFKANCMDFFKNKNLFGRPMVSWREYDVYIWGNLRTRSHRGYTTRSPIKLHIWYILHLCLYSVVLKYQRKSVLHKISFDLHKFHLSLHLKTIPRYSRSFTPSWCKLLSFHCRGLSVWKPCWHTCHMTCECQMFCWHCKF